MINNINFQGNYIKPAVIKRDNGNGEFLPQKVSVVELDIDSCKDRALVANIAKEWGRQNFIDNIEFDIQQQRERLIKNNKFHVFVLTSQEDDFNTLRKDEVMAMAEFKERLDSNELVYLQVDPENNYSNPFSEYKHIGKAMLDFLQDNFVLKPLIVFPTPSAQKFYLKNNFTSMPAPKEKYMWNA